jgi:hypothetical protein
MSQRISRLQTLCLTVALGAVGTAPVLAKSFSLGAEEKNYLDTAPPLSSPALQGYGSQYGAQPMNQQTPQYAPAQPYQGGATQQAPRPPLQVTVSKTLPQGFLGQWHVTGGRTKVEAADPSFQQQAANAFQMQTANTWTISGNPGQGYSIGSDTGVNFQLWVDKVANGVAFVRYQHPVNNTVAQEAIVMQLGNGGATFSGLERISIVKNVPGQAPVTRCKVQYQLNGQRMR